jgi:hypothetical protein
MPESNAPGAGRWTGPYNYRSCGISWDAPPGRRTGEWWACPNGCNWDIVDRYREGTFAEARREMDEHAARVRVHQEAVAQEIEAILHSDPNADDFAERMSDERPRTAEENLALVRGTDPRPTVMEKAELRSEDIKAGVWRGKRRRGECRFCSKTYWFYPTRQKGHFCSQQCRTRFWNLRRGTGRPRD